MVFHFPEWAPRSWTDTFSDPWIGVEVTAEPTFDLCVEGVSRVAHIYGVRLEYNVPNVFRLEEAGFARTVVTTIPYQPPFLESVIQPYRRTSTAARAAELAYTWSRVLEVFEQERASGQYRRPGIDWTVAGLDANEMADDPIREALLAVIGAWASRNG